MAERGGAHAALRAGTRGEHERLDGLFAGFDLADPAAYRAFLTAHAMALPTVEAALDAADFAAVLADWPERRRGQALAGDLAALDTAMPAPLAAPVLADRAAQWGAAYVLEGSRLGGAFLARQIADDAPRAYLGTPQAPGRWRDFLAQLDAAVTSPDELAHAQAAARAVFALFEQAGRTVGANG